MLTSQKKLTKPFFVLLSLPATAMGFALSVQIAALRWIPAAPFRFCDELPFQPCFLFFPGMKFRD